MPAPHFVFNGHWGIKPDGTILVNPKLPIGTTATSASARRAC